jgi:hypothetical protein
MQSNKPVHCEKTGVETTLDKTRVVTKISGVINPKLFENAQIDFEEKVIYSSNKPPIKFFSKIHVPADLKPVLGDLYAKVSDEDEPEQSTHILSDQGMKYLMGSQLIKLVSYIDKYEVIHFPETMFFVSVEETSGFKTQNKICENSGVAYQGLGKKYMVKKILESKTEKQTFGYMNVLLPPFDMAFSDCSATNPNGTGYLFRTDRNFTSVSLSSNESAVDFCIKNNCLVYYNDYINGGNMRVLSKYTPDINAKLQNHYRFRSSNL